jgi:hypothetical protein
LKAQSHSHVKELRQKNAKNMKPKSSKRLYENALRLNTFYSHLFTATVSLDSSQWFKKIKETIDSQQEQPLWISQDLEHLLANNSNNNTTANNGAKLGFPCATNYATDMSLQQQKFVAKQNQLMQQNRYVLDDNFEFPIYTPANTAQTFSGTGASSTYSLYEDNNYRSSIAASENDLNTAGLNNTTNNSSPIIKNNSIHNSSQPIYSTNFHNNRNDQNINDNMNAKNSDTSEEQNHIKQNQVNSQSLLTRVHSDPNIMALGVTSNVNPNDASQNHQHQQEQQQFQLSSINENKFSNQNVDNVMYF